MSMIPGDSAVGQLRFQGVKLEFCDDLEEETFQEFGAKVKISRYDSPFGKRFFKEQKIFLGTGLIRAEKEFYLEAIDQFLSLNANHSQQFLIDLMAGGSNDRFIHKIFPKFGNLQVLAIDRDTRHLADIVEIVGERFAIIEQEINGRIGLEKLVKESLETDRVDLVIGKKALHELSRENQIELIRECGEILRPGGRLILFTDSPRQISEEGFRRLQQLRDLVRRGEAHPVLRQQLIDDLELGASSDDCAIFSNLWVLLKDWANANTHEVMNRYFSSINEIQHWSSEAGLKPLGRPQREHYKLIARMFNEAGINKVGLYLQRFGETILPDDMPQIRKDLVGSFRHQLFYDFAEKHLWDTPNDRPTALGNALEAGRAPVDFARIHRSLRKIDLPYQDGVYFKFSVHVVTFEKT